jgi:hypothetical protein
MDPTHPLAPKYHPVSDDSRQPRAMFAPTATEIHRVDKLLRSFNLPVELRISILDFAEYWVKESHVKNNPFKLAFGQSALFFQTDPIGCKGEFLRPIKIDFEIYSSMLYNVEHDDKASKNVLLSWFEASIFRRDDHWKGEQQQTPLQAAISWSPLGHQPYTDNDSVMIYTEDDLYSTPNWLRRDALKLKGGYELIGDGHDPFWFLTSSDTGLPCRILSKQTVTWDKRIIILPVTGSTKKNKFLSLLQTNDIIGLWARIQPDEVSKPKGD